MILYTIIFISSIFWRCEASLLFYLFLYLKYIPGMSNLGSYITKEIRKCVCFIYASKTAGSKIWNYWSLTGSRKMEHKHRKSLLNSILAFTYLISNYCPPPWTFFFFLLLQRSLIFWGYSNIYPTNHQKHNFCVIYFQYEKYHLKV